MSTTMWTSRGRPPFIETSPTPSTPSRTRLTCLSAISVNVRRLIDDDESVMLMIGAESGSAFWMTGGSTWGGTFLIAPETFSRTALAASSRSRSRTKRTVILPRPLLALDCIWSMPEMPLIAFSIGISTDVTISSGLAPGNWRLTLTVAGSALGKRSTPRSRKEKIPTTTSDITSIVAKTGRRTQSSDNIKKGWVGPGRHAGRPLRGRTLFDVAADGDLLAVGELFHVGDGHLLARLH